MDSKEEKRKEKDERIAKLLKKAEDNRGRGRHGPTGAPRLRIRATRRR